MTAATRTSTRPLVIEFLGPPGAGKSTLLPMVRDLCRDAGLSPATMVESARPLASRTWIGRLVVRLPDGRIRSHGLWLVFRLAATASSVRQIVRTWPLAWRVLGSQRGRVPGAESGSRRVLYWFHRLLGGHGLFLRCATTGEVLLLDEGYVHRVVQLFASAVEVPDPAAVHRYLETVPVPDLTVVVRAPIERCRDRVSRRGVWPRFAGRDADELRRFIASAHRATMVAADYARDQGWDLIEVDNGADGLDACQALLRAALTERLASGMGVAR
jgi:thymidylate kinase